MDNEFVQLLLRVAFTTFILMGVIALCCILTPHLAKWIDRHRPRPTVDEAHSADEPQVRGAFDASSDPDYDLNYKIYNTDIYGVDLKNGKEKNG